MKKYKVIILTTLLIFILACNLIPGSKEADLPEIPTAELATQQPLPTVEPPTAVPTEILEPTEAVEPTEVPQPTEAPVTSENLDGGLYYEDFNVNPSSWGQWNEAGDPSKNFTTVTDGQLQFNLPSPTTYSYAVYNDYVYTDVFVTAQVETKNSGRNGGAVICRYSDDGWYEMRIVTSGLNSGSYEVYRYDKSLDMAGKNPYVRLIRDERYMSPLIKNGNKTNIIGLSCVGPRIDLFINGQFVQLPFDQVIIDETYSEGNVGVGAMSYGDGMVNMLFDYVEVKPQ
jgi:hypothetical protein